MSTDAPVDTLVRGTLVNVHTGTLEEGVVAVDDGEIVALEERPADRELTAEYIAPGLIDAHLHIESSLVTLSGFADAVVPHGVTGIVWDPHEIANVLGEDGVRATMADARETPLKTHFAVPSTVPASPLQDTGATLGPDAVERLLDADQTVALAEVMDLAGVLDGDPTVHDKIDAARERGLTVDAHLPGVSGAQLQAASRYLDTTHENVTQAEAREKLAAGFRVYLRARTPGSESLADLLELVETVDSRWVSLATDDRRPDDLHEEGGVNVAVETALREGHDPVESVSMATLNTAEAYDLPSGRLLPGAPADLVLLDDLEEWSVAGVMIDGELDPTEGTDGDATPTAMSTDTVSFDPVSPQDIAHPAPPGHDGGSGSRADADGTATQRVRAIDCTGKETTPMITDVPVSDGYLQPDLDGDVLPVAVVERHGNDGGIGTGFVHGFDIDSGAIASTVGYHAHNLTVVGTDHAAMAHVTNHLQEVGGGYAVYDASSDEMTTLALPAAGLMADKPVADVAEEYRTLLDAGRAVGIDGDRTFMTLSILSWEITPQLRITNNGLVDATSMEYVDLIVGDS